MSNGKIISQACEVLRKTYSEINKMKNDLSEIFQITTPQMEFDNEYSFTPTGLRIREWHVIKFREVSEDQTRKNGGLYFFMILIFYNNDVTKHLTSEDEPEIWCGLVKITNSKQEISLWEVAEFTNEKYKKYFSPADLNIGGSIHRCLYDEKDKYGKWEGDFVGYKLTDISSREKLKELIVDKLFNQF